jgi:hypothetical protein
VMRSGSVEAWRRQGPGGNRPSRWMRRGCGSLRRRARDAPSGRRRGTRDGHLYVGTANVWRQRRAKRVRCTPGLGAGATGSVRGLWARSREPRRNWRLGAWVPPRGSASRDANASEALRRDMLNTPSAARRSSRNPCRSRCMPPRTSSGTDGAAHEGRTGEVPRDRPLRECTGRWLRDHEAGRWSRSGDTGCRHGKGTRRAPRLGGREPYRQTDRLPLLR